MTGYAGGCTAENIRRILSWEIGSKESKTADRNKIKNQVYNWKKYGIINIL